MTLANVIGLRPASAVGEAGTFAGTGAEVHGDLAVDLPAGEHEGKCHGAPA